jgi:photosystem II stability/assembly factor-like uncharacterized protein
VTGSYVLVTTTNGLSICKRVKTGWEIEKFCLERKDLTCVTSRQGVILVGGVEGVYRSVDFGQSWSESQHGLHTVHARWLAAHPDIAGLQFLGTEPAGIFISQDAGESWRESQEVVDMREKFGWQLPYSPEAGCVRGFAIQGSRLYAAVEDGCVLISDNYGENWRLAAGSRGYSDHSPRETYVHSDVHSIETHPSSSDLVYAPTGGGFFCSTDGGENWEKLYRNTYVRAVWVDNRDSTHLILGPADSVDRGGRIEESQDGGRTWRLASEGLDVPWKTSMVERFSQIDDYLLAVLSNGKLISAHLLTLDWQTILDELNDVSCVALFEG